VTLGGCGIWALVDLIMVLVGSTRDAQGLPLAGYEANKKTAWIVTIVLWVLGGISGVANSANITNQLQNSSSAPAVVRIVSVPVV